MKRIVNTVFKLERKKLKGDLSIIFVDNKMIKRLNKKFLNESHNTDVIAFPYDTKDTFGDIYISIPMAKQNAKRYGEPAQHEIMRLIIHGILHLLGYDDHKPQARKKMWDRQEKLVKKCTRE